jgi:hypothetical protein
VGGDGSVTISSDRLRDKRPQFLRVFDSEYRHFRTIPKGTRAYAIAVYVCLASHANSKSDIVFPSHATICDHTGLSKNTVLKAIDALIESGHIMVQTRTSTGLRISNLYTLLSVVVRDVNTQDIVVHDVTEVGHVATEKNHDVTEVVRHVNRNQTNEPDPMNQIKEPEREAPSAAFAASPPGGSAPPLSNFERIRAHSAKQMAGKR